MVTQRVEFLGGPLDGRFLWVAPPLTTIVYRDGMGAYRYDVDQIHEGPKVRTVLRCTTSPPSKGKAMSDKQPFPAFSAEPDVVAKWIPASEGTDWGSDTKFVTIRCREDASVNLVGLVAGPATKPVCIVRGGSINDGRDYYVSHYCPFNMIFPDPSEDGRG